MVIEKPIFIIGTGRSGSTAFFDLFSRHPNLAWLSGLNSKYPDKPQFNRILLRMVDFPILEKFFSRLGPAEAYPFWEHHCRGFSRPYRDLTSEDVSNRNKQNIRKIFGEIPTPKRYRMLIKITGWPRIGFLNEIFPDARFIHVVRDGKAVTNSLLNVGWWEGWQGPYNWRFGELSLEHMEIWKKANYSFVALAALGWKILIDAVNKGKANIDSKRFLDISYEKLCDIPQQIFAEVQNFCELSQSKSFEKTVQNYPLKNMNYKWKEDLTKAQQDILNSTLGEFRERK